VLAFNGRSVMKYLIGGAIGGVVCFFSSYLLAAPLMTYPNQIEPRQVSSVLGTKVYKYRLKSLEMLGAKKMMQDIYPDLVVSGDPDQRIIVYRATHIHHRAIQTLLKKWDQAKRQIKLQLMIYEVTQTYHEDDSLGVDSVLSSLTLQDIKQGELMSQNLWESSVIGRRHHGEARVIANPELVMIDQKKSRIKVGDRVPYLTVKQGASYQTQSAHFLDTGLDLELNVEIISKEDIRLSIHATLTSINGWKMWEGREYPILSSRSVETEVQLKNQETMVMAGLIHRREQETRTSIPILGDLPILGTLFQTRVKEEIRSDIIFVMTPTLL
jgi:general secretion pathway protein D